MTQPSRIEVRKFKANDLGELRIQDAQSYMQELASNSEYGKALELHGGSFSVLKDGQIVASGGIINKWHGVGQAWALLSDKAPPHMLLLTRLVRVNLEAHLTKLWRIETTVERSFELGHRWVRMLGFEHEGSHRKFSPQGFDCDTYARIK